MVATLSEAHKVKNAAMTPQGVQGAAVKTKENLYATTAVVAYIFSLILKKLRYTEEQLETTATQQVLSQFSNHSGVLQSLMPGVGIRRFFQERDVHV